MDHVQAEKSPPTTILRTEAMDQADWCLEDIRRWMTTLERPSNLHDSQYKHFLKRVQKYFIRDKRLWKRDSHGKHKMVLAPSRRLPIMEQAHDRLGHKEVFATMAHISERFWWPFMHDDIKWYVQTCHLCQTRQVQNVLILPTVAVPAPIFAKVYMDSMHMPKSNGFKYLVQGRCSLTHYPEFRMLRSETSRSLADWIFQDIICRWGSLSEIVSDNGPAFVKALTELEGRYGIKHIRISGYNSRANGIVERTHFDV